MRFRRLAIGAALVLGAGIAAPAVARADTTPSAPASPVYCTFGDNFYQFASDYSGYNQDIDSAGFLENNYGGNGYQWCQVYAGVGGYYEWALKGTSYCMTLNAGAYYRVDLVTCRGAAAQQWALVDNLGGEDWGGVESYYDVSRYLAQGYYEGTEARVTTGWMSPPVYQWEWTLRGPYR